MCAGEPIALPDLFCAAALEHRLRPALWVDGCEVSYAELYDAAIALAAALTSARGGLRGGQCALLVDRTAVAYRAVLGTLMAGLAYVPLNPRIPGERLLDMMMSSRADVIIVDDRCIAVAEHVLTSCPRPLIVVFPDLPSPPDWAERLRRHRFLCRTDVERPERQRTDPLPDPQVGAYLLFTSGSTGVPKGVLISHRNAVTYIQNVRDRYRPSHDDRFTQLFDFSFDLSVHDMFLCWSAGACLYCIPQSVKYGPRDFIRRHQLTFWFSVPSTAAFMARMHMLGRGDFPTLRWSLFCGEALPTGLARQWQAAAPNSTVENLYGPTEATVAFTAYRLPPDNAAMVDEQEIVPIGWPLPGQVIAVIDTEGRSVPDGEVGELCLGGSQVAAGYWDLPQKTAERFAAPRDASPAEGPWYRTGDLVVRNRELGLLFRGRIDRQVKIRGYRIELQEIESVIRAAAGTDLVGVIPWPVTKSGLASGLVGLVSGRQAANARIMDECRRRLPEYMVPKELYDLASWPLTANGKTDYAWLRSFLEHRDVGSNH
jgi:amino acid adenylation domain-containing protein